MILYVTRRKTTAEAGSLSDALFALGIPHKVLRKRLPHTVQIADEHEGLCQRLALDLGISLSTEPIDPEIRPDLHFVGKSYRDMEPRDEVEEDSLFGKVKGAVCNVTCDTTSWVCTREKNHRGDHVAGNRTHIVARWAGGKEAAK